MEEDALAPFADLLADTSTVDAVQELDRLQEHLNDYGESYDYINGFPGFSIWDDIGIESKQIGGQSQTQDAGLKDQTELDDSADALDGEVCAFCLEGRVLTWCLKCKSAYYCSEHLLIHEASCGRAPAASEFSPCDSELRSEILVLLSIFQSVYEEQNKNSESSLQKCISMCESIMERYYRLPQVVAMHEQATTLLLRFQNGETGHSSFTASNSRASSSSSYSSSAASGMSVLDHLKADVKVALDRVDAEENDLVKDSDVGEEVNGVYCRIGIRYCKIHMDREHCERCGVDYRLLNEFHRENAKEEEVDDTIRKEQERLEELERKLLHYNIIVPPLDDPDPATIDPTAAHSPTQMEDFQFIAKDLKAELDRAREKEEAEFLKSFASFQIS